MSLAQIYATHKGLVSDKWDIYLSEYERLFHSLKMSPIRLLEVGVQNGGSVEIWNNYFPNATTIIGCDIDPNCGQLSYASNKIKIIIGDIKNQQTRNDILAISSNLDVIIDDGSHTSNDIIQTFCLLFPYLSQNGVFIAEDLHCSYWSQWEGGLYAPTSSMAFFKALADIINFEHWELDQTRTKYLQRFCIAPELTEPLLAEIHSVEFVNSMCIVTRRPIEENLLGKRHVVGQAELICSVKQVDGTFCESPPQSLNAELIEISVLQDLRLQMLEKLAHLERKLDLLQTNQ